MAYTREKIQACPTPCDPGVLTFLANAVPSGSTSDSIIKVPWNNCKLVYGYTMVTTAVSSKAVFKVDLELTAASGTQLATCTQSKSAAVGTVVDFTMGTVGASSVTESSFLFDDGGLINIEVNGGSSASIAGQALVYMFFEPAIY